MKNQVYTVKLSSEERETLEKFVRSTSKKNTPQSRTHARVILCLDENSEKPMAVGQTAKKCKLHPENVYKIRRQFVLEGMDRILNRKKRETPPVPSKVTGEVEAHIIATACSETPEGHKSWTLQMIKDKIVLDGVIDSIGKETVRKTIKKHNLSLT